MYWEYWEHLTKWDRGAREGAGGAHVLLMMWNFSPF